MSISYLPNRLLSLPVNKVSPDASVFLIEDSEAGICGVHLKVGSYARETPCLFELQEISKRDAQRLLGRAPR